MTPLVIDISHYQPTPNWGEVRKSGIVGVILKCTEGESYVDDTWMGRATDALVAGLAVSTYHFLRPGSMEDQMRHYIDEQDKVMPLGSRVVLDYEDDRVNIIDLCACVQAIMDKRPDLQITIYSGHVIKEKLGNTHNDLLAKNTSLWIAQYTTGTPTWPTATWPQWSLWQYTDTGTVKGISGHVDLDAFNGSAEACVKWMGPAGNAQPGPDPDPGVEVVYVDVNIGSVPVGFEVRVRVNGEIV
jgi:lysozyme